MSTRAGILFVVFSSVLVSAAWAIEPPVEPADVTARPEVTQVDCVDCRTPWANCLGSTITTL